MDSKQIAMLVLHEQTERLVSKFWESHPCFQKRAEKQLPIGCMCINKAAMILNIVLITTLRKLNIFLVNQNR